MVTERKAVSVDKGTQGFSQGKTASGVVLLFEGRQVALQTGLQACVPVPVDTTKQLKNRSEYKNRRELTKFTTICVFTTL